MSEIFKKIKLLWQRPKVIIVTGQGKETAKEAITQLLQHHFKVGKEALIYQSDLKDVQEFKFLVKRASLTILVITQVGEYHPEREFFAGDINQVVGATKLAEILSAQAYLILNFDDETVREIKNKSRAHPLTFGFGRKADIRASDLVLTGEGTNFKINYEGNIVPVWLEKLFGKEHVYAALATVAVGEVLDLNLVEISEALKSYQGLPGKMRLIKGIKNSWILDNSEAISVFSVIEALEILGKIESQGRKIAVLGDILGIGKYTIEAHEAMGEKVAKTADLLFTFGARAKFIGQGAQTKGMALEKIFQYDIVDTGKISLQNEIRPGDVVLISGLKEKIKEVIKEVMLIQ